MARPRKKVDTAALVMMVSRNFSIVDCASILGVSCDTLYRRHKRLIEKARAALRGKLAGCQVDVATGQPAVTVKDKDGNETVVQEPIAPNPQMLIWMGKQLLGQKDKQDVTSDDKPITVKVMHGVSMDDI